MSYYANGELKTVFLSRQIKTISEEAENAFLYINQRYDYGLRNIGKYDHTVIEAWGNELYSITATEKLLELLTDIAPIKEGSELDFYGEDQTYWRFILKDGHWKEQCGEMVYHD